MVELLYSCYSAKYRSMFIDMERATECPVVGNTSRSQAEQGGSAQCCSGAPALSAKGKSLTAGLLCSSGQLIEFHSLAGIRNSQ